MSPQAESQSDDMHPEVVQELAYVLLTELLAYVSQVSDISEV
jgi:hypothetical protein